MSFIWLKPCFGRVLFAVVTMVLTAGAVRGHSFELTQALMLIKADGSYQIDVTCDLDALALGVSPTADSAELAATLEAMSADELATAVDRLRRSFDRRVRIRFDGEADRPRISFPGPRVATESETELPTFLGLTARFEGRLPPAASEITFRASRAFPPVHLTILDERYLTGSRELLETGSPSSAYRLDEAPEEPTSADDRFSSAGRYLALGFWHIVPEGLDHILFVLGLFLLAARWQPLLWQVSAFTAAHTLTLALSTYGVVRLPSSWVEPLIALSIVYVAVENLTTDQLKPWRPAVVFAFGLLHGLGFAGVLGELGLPESDQLAVLLAFNVGVELGQLAVLLVAFAAVGWLQDRSWYRQRIVVPASLAIAAIGFYWAVERVLGG